jgi:hypothetical protein
MSLGRVNYCVWLLRVLAWDTLLPLIVAFVPYAIHLLLPKQRGILEVVAVTLPILAFFLRIRAGKPQIATNQCSERARAVQFGVFLLGVLPLVLVDCFMILSHLMPQGSLFATKTDLFIWATIALFYLTCMAIAMYPGSQDPDSHDLF